MNALEMSKNGYLILFHSNEWWKDLGREQLEKYVAESNAWLEKVMATGKVKAGQALARSGAIISGKTGRVITDGPFAESKEVLGGLLIIEARDLNQAVELISNHPGVKMGAWEIRPTTDLTPMLEQSKQRRGANS